MLFVVDVYMSFYKCQVNTEQSFYLPGTLSSHPLLLLPDPMTTGLLLVLYFPLYRWKHLACHFWACLLSLTAISASEPHACCCVSRCRLGIGTQVPWCQHPRTGTAVLCRHPGSRLGNRRALALSGAMAILEFLTSLSNSIRNHYGLFICHKWRIYVVCVFCPRTMNDHPAS